MKAFLFIVCIAASLASCVPTRVGKVKLVNTGELKKGDSVLVVLPFYTYATESNSFSLSKWDGPTEQMTAFENRWDSVQLSVVSRYFKPKVFEYGYRHAYWGVRPFRFKVLLGGTEEVKSDTASWQLSNFTWNLRAGDTKKAFEFLPDTLLQLSYNKPVVIFTNDFFFFERSFQAGFASGTTGLNVIPNCVITILINGEPSYVRSYRKNSKAEKLLNNSRRVENVNLKLFDKM
jgi:hypothetical protein